MYVVPLVYLICYCLAIFGKFGVVKHEKCDSICNLASNLFVHLGLFLYITVHMLTLWRRKQFFVDFEKSLEDIDKGLRKCDELGVKQERKKEKKYVYYATWLLVIVSFSFAIIYDMKELI